MAQTRIVLLADLLCSVPAVHVAVCGICRSLGVENLCMLLLLCRIFPVQLRDALCVPSHAKRPNSF